MQLKFFCPCWGSEEIPFPRFVKQALDDGYDGVEISLPESKELQQEYLAVLSNYDIPFILQHPSKMVMKEAKVGGAWAWHSGLQLLA